MAMTAAVFRLEDIPSASQAIDKMDRVGTDLSGAQQSEASGRDCCAIVDGPEVTIMAPISNLGVALSAILAERVTQGI